MRGDYVPHVPVPDFQSLMRPLLAVLEDGSEQRSEAIRTSLADRFQLTPADRQEMLPSGRVTVMANRVAWALSHLYQAGLIERPERGIYRIAARGRDVGEQNPSRVDLRVLAQFDEYRRFRARTRTTPGSAEATPVSPVDQRTPREQLEAAYGELRSSLAEELLDSVLAQPPAFFETLVLDVLQAMGYGGSRVNSVETLGRSGDEGVDGVIREDPLGLDLIYVQAKRWTNVVGRPEIQRFVGALQGQHASKGVFITTSAFSAEAAQFAATVSPRTVLIDGGELADLMIQHDVGVTVSDVYRLGRVDLDYFLTEDGSGAAP